MQIAAHILSPFGIRPIFDKLAAGHGRTAASIGIGPDNLFIHMTGMADPAWQKVKDVGAQVSLAVPIEMNMRHGMPPILKMQELDQQKLMFEPSLSVDVECTLTADFFTQMRSCMNLQRALVNQMILEQGNFYPPNQWPTPAARHAPLLTARDVLRYATINGAKGLRLDKKTGSLTPGKEADIIILDASAINVAPLNHVPGAVVSLMERSNVETVIVAGKVRKWKGRLLGHDLAQLRTQLEDSARLRLPGCRRPQGAVPLRTALSPRAGSAPPARRRSRASPASTSAQHRAVDVDQRVGHLAARLVDHVVDVQPGLRHRGGDLAEHVGHVGVGDRHAVGRFARHRSPAGS